MKQQWEYAAILHHSRPRSERHRPIPNGERAAQFAPFAALTGLDEALDETARQLADRLEEAGRGERVDFSAD